MIMEGTLQYVSTEDDTVSAALIADTVTSSIKNTYAGSYDNHSGSDSATYGYIEIKVTAASESRANDSSSSDDSSSTDSAISLAIIGALVPLLAIL